MGWAHKADPEWNAFVADNANAGGMLLFGRVTYEMMASFWPTPMALEVAPAVARRMNALSKAVFSRTLREASWENTRLLKEDPAAAVRRLKAEPGPDITVLGSGSIVSQLAQAGLIDVYTLVFNPLVLGQGKALFAGVTRPLGLRLAGSRVFGNGNVLLRYEAAR